MNLAIQEAATATPSAIPSPIAENATTSWDPIVGIGTLLMGVATLFLAWQTRNVSRETKRSVDATRTLAEAAERELAESQTQTDLARQTLESSIRPILADIPLGSGPARVMHTRGEATGADKAHVIISDEEDYVLCSLVLRNVGTGVAFIRGLGLRFDGDLGWAGKQTKTVVPPGEHTRFTFEIPKDRLELKTAARDVLKHRLVLEVRYTDVNGRQDTITRAHVMEVASGITRVRQVFLLRPGEEEPFVASGPADF